MIKHLIFDLDDTIYSQSCEMSKNVTARIKEFSRQYFNFTQEEINVERPKALKKYCSTLEWLHSSGFSDDKTYFEFVHPDSEINELEFDQNLKGLLESINLPKVILTNAPSEHAERVLKFFGIRDLFNPTISDIRRNKLKGKPFDFAYKDALSLVGGTFADTLFLDDYIPYCEGFAKLGGTAVVVGQAKEVEITKIDNSKYPGKILSIKDIYELPALLEKLNISTLTK